MIVSSINRLTVTIKRGYNFYRRVPNESTTKNKCLFVWQCWDARKCSPEYKMLVEMKSSWIICSEWCRPLFMCLIQCIEFAITCMQHIIHTLTSNFLSGRVCRKRPFLLRYNNSGFHWVLVYFSILMFLFGSCYSFIESKILSFSCTESVRYVFVPSHFFLTPYFCSNCY